ncbi:MAG: ABC transporter permease [Nitrososphaerota archaeon]|jgi:ABC-type antimicrobial peptide transport system permease subunit|nr:ABC transporter permease [Nitrososphaerota archaeon]MDG6927710.1 ABC transporter permease [Nitrososphaerota archaeon]MDG6930177.1 ABC transporter permease [Nitrososphaerota archaeon]MDG6932050.1 ABC transporter permease [Nitrososphaerota archaeon]MDG6935425.1 ABC transporter permease [Nitrososphaerota archaeon]
MKLIDVMMYAIRAMSERKTRSALTILGIMIGPAAVIGITSLTSGYGQNIHSQLLELGTNTILVEPNGQKTITVQEINQIETIKGVSGVYPYYAIPAQISTPGGKESVVVFAINLQTGLESAVPGIKLSQGQFPQQFNTFGAVIGWQIANPQDSQYSSYKLNNVVTMTISVKGQQVSKSFLVMGILKEFGPSFIVNVDQGVFVPLNTGSQLTGNSPYDGLLVIAQSSSDVTSITNSIKGYYGNNLQVLSSQEAINVANSIVGTLNLLLASAASVSFLVAFVGVTTTMYTSTLERIREIGILKALGFRNNDVMNIFMLESGIMGLVGGLIGVTLGAVGSYALSLIIPRFLNFGGQSGFSIGYAMPVFDPSTIAIVVVISAIIGIIAGSIPAYKASRVEPVRVLRNE